MTNSVLNSPPQLPGGAAGAWGSLLAVDEFVNPCHSSTAALAARKQPAAYGIKRNLDMCTEALGCETGGVDAAAYDAFVVDEGADRKRRAREEEIVTNAKTWTEKRVLPPPLSTLAGGASRVRMVHERRGGRLEVYAVRAAGMEADRSGGRLRLRFLPCDSCNEAMCSRREPQEAEKKEVLREEQQGVAKYERDRRCLETAVVLTTVARRRGGNTWEPEQAAAFWVAIT